MPVVDAVATPNGNGYWLLYANGAVAAFGDATALGGPIGYVNSFNPATAIFPTADGRGYWVAAARGDVFAYGVCALPREHGGGRPERRDHRRLRLLASGAERLVLPLRQLDDDPVDDRAGRCSRLRTTPGGGGRPRRRPG